MHRKFSIAGKEADTWRVLYKYIISQGCIGYIPSPSPGIPGIALQLAKRRPLQISPRSKSFPGEGSLFVSWRARTLSPSLYIPVPNPRTWSQTWRSKLSVTNSISPTHRAVSSGFKSAIWDVNKWGHPSMWLYLQPATFHCFRISSI